MPAPASHATRVRWRDGIGFASCVFIALRLIVSLVAIVAAGRTTPPSFDPDGPVTPGVHNAVDGLNRWDALRFESIAADGYRLDGGDAAFFPGYPLTIRAVTQLSPLGVVGAATLVSNASFLAALVALYALTARGYDRATARRALVLLACFPTSFFFLAPFSESLFLLCSVLAFCWSLDRRPVPTGVAGAAAGLVRSAGVLLVPALAAEAWQGRQRDRGRMLAAAAGPLLGLGAYAAFWFARTGDALAPIHAQSAWFRRWAWPPVTLWKGLRLAVEGVGDARGVYWTIDALVVGIALVALIAGWGRLRATYRIYAATTVLAVLAYPLPERPLLSAPRLLIVLFPIYWAMAVRLRGRAFVAAAAVMGAGMIVLLSFFVNWGYVF
jgi:Mannosyltransferase (PIG-V)